MNTRFGLRFAGLTVFVAAVAAMLLFVPAALGAGNAAYTTFDTTQRGCLNGNPNGVTTGDTGSGDPLACRTFTVSAGLISSYNPGTDCTDPTGTGTPAYSEHAPGTDPQGNSVIGLAPFDDTDQPGGVYIVAICSVGASSASDCKFDAF